MRSRPLRQLGAQWCVVASQASVIGAWCTTLGEAFKTKSGTNNVEGFCSWLPCVLVLSCHSMWVVHAYSDSYQYITWYAHKKLFEVSPSLLSETLQTLKYEMLQLIHCMRSPIYMRSCIDVVCPCYSNFCIGITLLHHNGTTVHGREEIQQGLHNNAHSYDNIPKKQLLACSLTGTFFVK